MHVFLYTEAASSHRLTHTGRKALTLCTASTVYNPCLSVLMKILFPPASGDPQSSHTSCSCCARATRRHCNHYVNLLMRIHCGT
ncbi:hypothetical protein BKA82DRAFT_298128 [Pisolithus tinctorius]|uniref:SWIM-type domain-containing protein n=1 Tax=Pisolithus tinctorius Marx 270 TaxID=870435 RepID=A0A0C3N3V3_PISTI|nr:hypothetical protein BKA82DRAFT_298128 [Pisolithus tinctorius]KIN95734.1 hypothetical protein M404DRAFT_298128 [Pisolithus tinctorius Marx 270]